MAEKWKKSIEDKGIIPEAQAWLDTQGEDKVEAWNNLTVPSWLWLRLRWVASSQEDESYKSLMNCVCDCAEATLPYIDNPGNRGKLQGKINAVKAWILSGISITVGLMNSGAYEVEAYFTAFVVALDGYPNCTSQASRIPCNFTRLAIDTASGLSQENRKLLQTELVSILKTHFPTPPEL